MSGFSLGLSIGQGWSDLRAFSHGVTNRCHSAGDAKPVLLIPVATTPLPQKRASLHKKCYYILDPNYSKLEEMFETNIKLFISFARAHYKWKEGVRKELHALDERALFSSPLLAACTDVLNVGGNPPVCI